MSQLPKPFVRSLPAAAAIVGICLLATSPLAGASSSHPLVVRISAPFSSTLGGPVVSNSTSLYGCSWERTPVNASFNSSNGRAVYALTGGARSCGSSSWNELVLYSAITEIPFARWTPTVTGNHSAIVRFVADGSLSVRDVYASGHSAGTSQLDWSLAPVIYQSSIYGGVWGNGLVNDTSLNFVTANVSAAWNTSIVSYVNGTFTAGTTYTLALVFYATGDFEALGHTVDLATFNVDFAHHGQHVRIQSAVIH